MKIEDRKFNLDCPHYKLFVGVSSLSDWYVFIQFISMTWSTSCIYPIWSIYGRFTYIYHVGKYTSPMDPMGIHKHVSCLGRVILAGCAPQLARCLGGTPEVASKPPSARKWKQTWLSKSTRRKRWRKLNWKVSKQFARWWNFKDVFYIFPLKIGGRFPFSLVFSKKKGWNHQPVWLWAFEQVFVFYIICFCFQARGKGGKGGKGWKGGKGGSDKGKGKGSKGLVWTVDWVQT